MVYRYANGLYPWYIHGISHFHPIKTRSAHVPYRSRHSRSRSPPTCRASRRSSHAADRDLQRPGPQKEEEIHGKMDQKLIFLMVLGFFFKCMLILFSMALFHVLFHVLDVFGGVFKNYTYIYIYLVVQYSYPYLMPLRTNP